MLHVKAERRKWWILAAMASTISMIFIDITVLPVSIPTIHRELDISEINLQWLINAYTLALASLLLAGGRFGDRIGHRRSFCFGALIFAFASALCGISTTAHFFITSRVLQGIGGALLLPATSAIIISSFPLRERGKAMGLYVSVGSLFLAAGPLLGGFFSEYLSWRLIFWINLPIAAVGITLALLFVPRSEKHPHHFDLLGLITLVASIICITLPIMQAKEWGWISLRTLVILAIGILLFILFVLLDKRVKDPLLDFKLFKNRGFLGATLSIFCTQFLISATVFWAIYFQLVLRYSPMEAGTISFVSTLPVIITAPIGGLLLDRFGPRVPIAIGYTTMTISILLFLTIYTKANLLLILLTLIPFGCAVSFIFTPCFTTAMNEVPIQKKGLASGIINTFRQFGATVGLALFAALFLTIKQHDLTKAFSQNSQTAYLDPESFSGLLAQDPPALKAFDALNSEQRSRVLKASESAYIRAFFWINIGAVGMGLIGAVIALNLIPKRLRDPSKD